MKDHGHCPNCNVDLNGPLVWQTYFQQGHTKRGADRIAKMYGATRTEGRFGREIDIYDQTEQRLVARRCPDCQHQWAPV